jgi:hypothetical protein
MLIFLLVKDNGYPGITCTIYYQRIKNALCDLGASVNLMLEAMFEELGYPAISPTTMTVQLADSSINYLKGIIENLLVNVEAHYVFADFVVLDTQKEMSLILGRPFLRDVNARIDVRAEKIQFRIGRRNMTFKFQAKEEQCYLVQDEESRGWRKTWPQYMKEKVTPTKPKVDSLITTMREQDKAFNERHQPKKAKAIKKAKGEKMTEIKNTPAKALPTSAPPNKTKKVWHVKRVSSESSTPGPDKSKIN